MRVCLLWIVWLVGWFCIGGIILVHTSNRHNSASGFCISTIIIAQQHQEQRAPPTQPTACHHTAEFNQLLLLACRPGTGPASCCCLLFAVRVVFPAVSTMKIDYSKTVITSSHHTNLRVRVRGPAEQLQLYIFVCTQILRRHTKHTLVQRNV